MDRLLKAIPYLILPFAISLILTPIIKRIGLAIDAYAKENDRTVHHGHIVRIGGTAIFVSFIVSMAVYFNADKTINGILIGSLFVFIGGLIDDIYDIKPITKLLFQLAGALFVTIYGGLRLETINLSFLFIDLQAISFIVTLFWIVGVTNAINLIDGLDGLSSGITVVANVVIGFIAFYMGRKDVSIISLLLIGSILGFLPYNFHPASIFVGDSGALFMGYMVSCLSLLGFKTSTFITLGFPIIILFIPLADTSLAIIRRKIKHQSVSTADRSHLHHVIMYKLGFSHKGTVILLYIIASLFGLCAILMYFYRNIGIIVLAILCILMWIFIELTGMINPKFHPIISLCRKITGHPKKSESAFFEANKPRD